MGEKNRAGKVRPEIAAKRLKALRMREAGFSFELISEKLGYKSPSSSFKAVVAAIKDTLREPADAVRKLELERLDRLMSGIWMMATQTRVVDGKTIPPNVEAVDRVLKIIRQRCDLLGLNVVAVRNVPVAEEPIPPQIAAAMIAAGLGAAGEKGGPET